MRTHSLSVLIFYFFFPAFPERAAGSPAFSSPPQPGTIKAMAWMLDHCVLERPPTLNKRETGLQIAAWCDPVSLWAREPEAWVADYEAWHRRQPGNRSRGAYYTPRPVAAYLTARTLGDRLDKLAIRARQCQAAGNLAQANTLLTEAENWRILDPACGAGVFLLEALLALHAFHAAVSDLRPAPPARQLLGRLHGTDIDPLAAAVCQARLYHWACRLDGVPPDDAPPAGQTTIRCGDTLAQATDRHWDFILGNPPYLSEVRGAKGRFRALAKHSGYYQAKMDLCDAFLAWSLAALQPNGLLAFVLPEYWLQRSSTAPLRQRLLAQGRMLESWHFGENSLFATAPGHHSHLLVWQKTGQPHPPDGNVLIGRGDHRPPQAKHLQPGRLTLHPTHHKLIIGPPDAIALLIRLEEAPPLLEADAIQQGLVMPQGRLKRRDQARLAGSAPGRPCPEAGFLLTESEVTRLQPTPQESAWLRPFYTPPGFQPFTGFNRDADYRIIYADAAFRREITDHPQAFARLKAHLDGFSPINTAAFAPYGLHRPRQAHWFETPHKLLCPRQVAAPAFAPVGHPAYVGEGFYLLRLPLDKLHAVCALLNSTLAWFWFYHHKRKGHRLQIDKDVLAAFPAPRHPQPEAWARLDALARRWTDARQAELDRLVGDLYGLNEPAFTMLGQWRDALTGNTPSVTMEGD